MDSIEEVEFTEQNDIDRNEAFKTFELEVRLPLLETENSPIYLNDI